MAGFRIYGLNCCGGGLSQGLGFEVSAFMVMECQGLV